MKNNNKKTDTDSTIEIYTTIRKKAFDWWTSPVNDNITYPKYEMNPNRLYYEISQEEKDKCYEYKTKGMYGAPLLKGH